MPKPKPIFSTVFFLILAILLSLQIHSATFSGDIAALQAFKLSVSPSSIPPSSCLATWNFPGDPCAVPRVTDFICAVSCSAGRVVQLTLDSQGYAGILTPSISNLTQLIYLDLGDNNFHGQIPSSISSLPNLKELILRVNTLTGPVPQSIANLRSLETLDLSGNSLSGALPDMSKLVNLKRLDLSNNKLTGSVPRLPSNLNELALMNNSLSGSLTWSVFAGLIRLMVVELSENSIAGVLESWFLQLPSLQQIDLAKNSITGVSVEKCPASELVSVNLSHNNIQGSLPVNFSEYPLLRSLALSHNRFLGPIPRQYSKKGSSLQRLFLDGNFLNGIPPVRFFSGEWSVSGSLGDNCLQRCPKKSDLCSTSQKNVSICQQAYGGKSKY
ncbi:hypothetical protein OROGR_009996 [Orobanche gracilis]